MARPPREQLVADLRALRPASGRRGGRAGAVALSLRPPPRSARGRGHSEPETLERFWEGSAAWREVAIDPRPTGPTDGVLRGVDAEVADLLGPEASVSYGPCTRPPLERRADDWILQSGFAPQRPAGADAAAKGEGRAA